MDPLLAVLLSIPLVLILLAAGIPVFASLGVAGFIGCAAISGLDMALIQLKVFPYVQTASYLLVVVPLFVIMGHFAFKAGIGKDVYLIGRNWFSQFPAGLGVATIVGSAGFAACSGSSVATAATMGAVAVPEMREQGYDPKLACGIVAAGGVLGILIPPSVILVFYGVITDTSVGSMLIAGVIPGILSVVIYILGLTMLSRIEPSLAPKPLKVSWVERFKCLRYGLGAFLLFFIVVGGIYIGWFTPTEAAAVGAFVSFIAMIVRRKQMDETLRAAIKDCFISTLRTSCMVFIVIVGAGLYSFFLTLAQVPQMVSAWVATLPVPPLIIVGLFLVLYIPLGMLLDSFSLLLVTLPIMFPVVVDQMGFSALWFGILSTKLCEVGLISPPVGLNVYVLAGVVRDVQLADIFKGCLWFVLFELVAALVLFSFPSLSYWLPMTMK
ncbi:C4-dicarboxylate ABC transporter permease [Desulfosarcina widdelii]|uniref:C4-dicarboxylate ABC transporter permease n=1 Tax=Desulfosarcina widdelii TaxID=947919 RepID=A0A5K7ZHE1_9BACT|nr:TRAP transporter large permease [Desulfosarcina widdelii]BBO79083.1 C4-dicarboxylate ABC transporter permease [Desulfosarcina widdelii]